MKKSSFWIIVILIFVWLSTVVSPNASKPFFVNLASRAKELAKNQAILSDFNKTLGMNLSPKNDLIDKRSETSKTFFNPEGSYTMETYGSNIHYKENYSNPDEFWKDIDQTHTVDSPDAIVYDRMPTIVKVFKNQTGYEIESRKSGQKFSVLLQDIDGKKVSKQESQKFAMSLVEKASAAETSPVHFDYEVSTNGVRLWKTIQGQDAPKTFTWQVTQTGSGNDLQFRDIPEAYQVINGQDRPAQQVKIQTQKEDIPNTKSFLWTETAPSSNLKIDTDVDFNPNANGAYLATSMDGEVARDPGCVAWSDIRDGAGTYAHAEYPNIFATEFAYQSGCSNWLRLDRSIFTFNTSTLPADATVSAATLKVYGLAKVDDLSILPDLNVYESNPASNSVLANSDYGTLGTTALSTAITYNGFTISGYNNFALNATGLTKVDKTGITKLGLRNANYDAANFAPTTAASNAQSYLQVAAMENGTPTAPTLSVRYSLPGDGNVTTGNVLLTGTVLPYTNLTIASGTTVSFGNITPGTPKCGDVTSQINVATNASGGYTLAVSDSVAGSNSAMIHADGATRIPDMNVGTLATPVVWVTGTHIGVGLNLYSGTQKNTTTWGTGTTACDLAYDKWAAVPQNATTGHTVTGYHASADSSYWGWRISVSNSQKTGIYSGNVLFTTAPVLN